MRKLLLSLTLAGLTLGLAALPASAEPTVITLGTGGGVSSDTVVFTADSSGGLVITFGSCSGTVCVDGFATGTGAFNPDGGLPTLDAWRITVPTSTTITAVESSPGSGVFDITQSGDLGFVWGGTGCSGAGCLLTGDLQLVNLSQTPGESTGEFNSQLQANLMITGGSFASVFTDAGGILNITFAFSGPTDLSALAASGSGFTTGSLTSGEIVPTPEPGSMLLLGSGLLALGTGLRRRIWRS